MKTAQYLMHSKIGALYLVASEKGLQGVFWKKQPVEVIKSLRGQEPAIKILAQTVGELSEYFEDDREKFTVPLDVVGTPFQMKVWDQLRKIPYGETRSYSDIASRIKNAKAVRAVGTANGRNPLSNILPCHRGIAA